MLKFQNFSRIGALSLFWSIEFFSYEKRVETSARQRFSAL